MVELLEKKNIPPVITAEFKDFLTLCTEKNLHIFQGSVYKFPDGFPIGGLLSTLIADVFMDKLESDILKSSAHSTSIRFWERYVDDILCVWNGNDFEAQSLFRDLNGYNGSMINYLDLHITLVEHDNILCANFGIFRKTSYTKISWHVDSLHPEVHKVATINAAISLLFHPRWRWKLNKLRESLLSMISMLISRNSSHAKDYAKSSLFILVIHAGLRAPPMTVLLRGKFDLSQSLLRPFCY